MVTETQKKKALTFLSLHTNGKLLILPNIWNPISARVLESKGYPAAATASSSISASLGFEDGEKIKRSTLINILDRIAHAVDIPVTADIETGYASSLDELEESIHQTIQAGIVGANIEDSLHGGATLRNIEDQCRRIEIVRKAANKEGLHFVINARIDSFLSPSISVREEKTENALIRAKAYFDAGADCVYPIGPGDEETVKILHDGIKGPINIFATPNAVPLVAMQELGVNRVSFGSAVFRSCLKTLEDVSDELFKMGSYECFSKNTLSNKDVKNYSRHDKE